MARLRNKKDQWMPPRVYCGKSAYEWHPKGGGAIRLCPLTATKAEVWSIYEEECKVRDGNGTFSRLVKEYLRSDKFLSLSRTTQGDYIKYSKKVLSVFSNHQINAITPLDIFNYHEIRSRKAKTQANREKTFMSGVFRWGYPRGKCKSNPCENIPKNREVSRDRYIEDFEYNAIYEVACPVVKSAMEIAYLCMARKGDILKCEVKQLQKDGIYIEQGKTNKKQIKKWGTRLKAAVKTANQVNPKVASMFVIHQENGMRYSISGFDKRWQNARDQAREKTGLKLDFTFHDIKAKGISDFKGTDGEKQTASGHKTLSQVATYNRKIQVVDTVETQNSKEY